MSNVHSRPELCGICGENSATTRDHVPPKSVFLKPRPSNLITVPACSNCNHSDSIVDEEFGAFVCAIATVEEGDTSSEMYRQRVIKPLRHNQRLYRQVVGHAELIELRTESGIVFGEVYATQWNAKAHDDVIRRTVKGLYFHHFGEVLSQSTDFSITVFRSWPEQLVQTTNDLRQEHIGETAFIYRYGRTVEDPNVSAWLLQFHEAHMVLVFTDKK